MTTDKPVLLKLGVVVQHVGYVVGVREKSMVKKVSPVGSHLKYAPSRSTFEIQISGQSAPSQTHVTAAGTPTCTNVLVAFPPGNRNIIRQTP